jgi:DNA-directed RNA polymerase
MLRFKTGKPMGEEGIRWTAINGANKYGNDKISLDDRVRWVHSQQESISRICSEPTGSFARSFLAEADKPFQFLAFCFEWRSCLYGKDAGAEGYLPVGLDGSCNGLQHYAALLRDRRGGTGVNLLPSSVPEDIYRDVANELLRLVPHDDMGKKFHAIGADRKLTKRPVMTLPYGSTQQSCREYIREYVGDNHEKFGFTDEGKDHWSAATYATPYMWQAIGNVVVAARTGMDWLQECAGIIGKKGIYSRWLSPADFPVYQHYCKHETVRVDTNLFGKIQLNIEGAQTDLNVRRARNGIAPNFVHALDSSHMVMTILESAERGHTDMAMIHDDFGVHACDTEEFYNLIRLTFVRMYYEHDWLQVWKKEQERLDEDLELPEPPKRGDLEILEVLESDFFFS